MNVTGLRLQKYREFKHVRPAFFLSSWASAKLKAKLGVKKKKNVMVAQHEIATSPKKYGNLKVKMRFMPFNNWFLEEHSYDVFHMKQNKTIKNETQQRYMHQKGKMHPTKPR